MDIKELRQSIAEVIKASYGDDRAEIDIIITMVVRSDKKGKEMYKHIEPAEDHTAAALADYIDMHFEQGNVDDRVAPSQLWDIMAGYDKGVKRNVQLMNKITTILEDNYGSIKSSKSEANRRKNWYTNLKIKQQKVT